MFYEIFAQNSAFVHVLVSFLSKTPHVAVILDFCVICVFLKILRALSGNVRKSNSGGTAWLNGSNLGCWFGVVYIMWGCQLVVH